MTLNKIEQLLLLQSYPIVKKSTENSLITKVILDSLGIAKKSEFYDLYSTYFLSNLDKRDDACEIVDPLPPQGFLARNQMAHGYWKIPKKYILFSSGSAEGGYLYNTEDNTVWDFQLGQQEALLNGTLPHWNSFYEFMEWYLTIDDEN